MIHETPTNGLSNGVHQSIAVGEIGLIRNILMGQYMQEYDDRFRLLEQKLTLLESDISARVTNNNRENNAQIESLEKSYTEKLQTLAQSQNEQIQALTQNANEKIQALAQKSDEKIAALEKVLLHNIGEINLRMVELSRSDRADIGKVLVDMGQKLMKA
jgi:DNA repair exonuclease SbcCD ATPase subunit